MSPKSGARVPRIRNKHPRFKTKPRAWLRHTPYPERKGRLKKQHSSLVQNPIPTAPRRVCRQSDARVPTPQRIHRSKTKPRAWLRHTPYLDRKGRLKKQHSSLVQNPIPTAPRRACRQSDARVLRVAARGRLKSG
ncbi:hypothetical protein [Kingella potus]|uniref:hypothetical protein n=1 Tax=Kingella potus TaxID=265175 RepID=UPI000E1B5A02|nr:hypothetical protein [Kingella potus]UOP00300.1 hypothetical protein LVJ84_10375 [Kingella potus]